jgi:hypothetical protein
VNIAKASREFNEGLRNIERAVIEGVLRKCGSNVGVSHDLTWHPGDFDVPPETIVLSVGKAGRKIDQTFDHAAITIAGIELAHRIRKSQFSFGRGRPSRGRSMKTMWDRALA